MPRKKKEEAQEGLVVEQLKEVVNDGSMEALAGRLNEIEHAHNLLVEKVFKLAANINTVNPTVKVVTRNIHHRIIEVMKEVEYIQKGDKLVNNQYRYVSHDKVAGVLHMPMANAGITAYDVGIEHELVGNTTIEKVTTRFTNADDKSDFIEAVSIGYGIDKGDKGPGKAQSYGHKYNLLKTFGLETGDDPDHDQNVTRDLNNASPHVPIVTTKKSRLQPTSNPPINKLEVITEYLHGFMPLEKLKVEKKRLVAKMFEGQSDVPNSASTDEANEMTELINSQSIKTWDVAVLDKIYKFITKE